MCADDMIIMQANGISGGYGPETVVRGVDLLFRRGDFTGIIGPNGSGKSTVLRLVTRALPLRAGTVSFQGQDIRRVRVRDLCRQIAFVPQETATPFSFTALEIVLMGRIPHLARLGFETRRDIEIAEEALRLTDALHLKTKEIDSLSAGERQRVMIARALAQEPTLLFLDEPTSHLDIAHQVQIMNLLAKLNRERALTVVIVLHDLNLASEYCSRLVLIDHGAVFTEGTPADVLTYQHIETVYRTVVLVGKNDLSGRPSVMVVSGDRSSLSEKGR